MIQIDTLSSSVLPLSLRVMICEYEPQNLLIARRNRVHRLCNALMVLVSVFDSDLLKLSVILDQKSLYFWPAPVIASQDVPLHAFDNNMSSLSENPFPLGFPIQQKIQSKILILVYNFQV